jgi:hypothetical protein
VKTAYFFFLREEVFLAFVDDFFFLPALNALSKFDEYLGVEPMRKMVTWCFLACN